jgi:hypothetical protein
MGSSVDWRVAALVTGSFNTNGVQYLRRLLTTRIAQPDHFRPGSAGNLCN